MRKGLLLILLVLVHCTRPEPNASPNVPDKPEGPTTGEPDREYIYSTAAFDPDGDSVQVQFAWGDGTQSNWSELVASGDTVFMTKSWKVPGTYYVKTRARDKHGATSSWSDSLKVEIGGNRAPMVAKPTGPANGDVNASYTFTVVATDPDGDSVQVQFAWGDGTQSHWSNFVASGSSVSMRKSWSSPGTYYVKARARDRFGSVSNWSDSLIVQIAQANYWWRTFGGSGYDEGNSICPAAGGGYVVAGYTMSFGSGASDFYVVRVDEGLNLVWQKTFGGAYYDDAYSICQANGGGYVVAGATRSYGVGSYDMFVLKLDESGNPLWQKTFGGRSMDLAYSVCPANDGGYVVAGKTSSFGDPYFNYYNVYVIKIDEAGNLVWQKDFGGYENDEARALCRAIGDGYIIVGHTKSFGSGGRDVYVLRIDEGGNLIWQKTFGGSNDDEAKSIVPVVTSVDTGYVIVGYTTSFGAGDSDVYVLKIDDAGNILWQRTFGGPARDIGFSIHQSNGMGYVIAGFTGSFGDPSLDAYVLSIDQGGNLLWQRTFGEVGTSDVAYSICPASGGGYACAGYTYSYGSGYSDVFIFKILGSLNLKHNTVQNFPNSNHKD